MERKSQDLGLVAGANLKRLLKETGRTQEDFADEFYYDVRTIRRWIRNGIDSISLIEKIADFFGVSVFDILSK